MKDKDPPTLITIPSTAASGSGSAATALIRKETSPSSSSSKTGGFLDKTRYKFWALAAILLLAFWSMFTGSVTLKWSTGNLSRLSDNGFDLPTFDDLDILEVEERQKVVRHMWDLYSQSTSTNRLPRFWQQAFEAAYENLSSDAAAVRDAAILEIAKMSIRSIVVDPFPIQSPRVKELRRRSKKAEESKKASKTESSS